MMKSQRNDHGRNKPIEEGKRIRIDETKRSS